MPQYFANGPWKPRSVQVPNPPATADFVTSVPSGVVWKVRAVMASFATSAVVASRTPRLIITDGLNTLWTAAPQVTETASSTVSYAWGVAVTMIGPNNS